MLGTGMNKIIAFILAFCVALTCAAQTYSSFEKYAEDVYRQPITDLNVDAAEHSSNSAKFVFGILGQKQRPATGEQTAVVFIVEELSDGKVREVTKSKPFRFSYECCRLNIEAIEAQSDRRFSIQINHSGACTSGFEIYRFAKIENSWRVSGRDSTQNLCDDDDKSSLEWSANFLTGRTIEKRFRGNKLVSDKTVKKSFPAFPLAEFAMFDSRYGPR